MSCLSEVSAKSMFWNNLSGVSSQRYVEIMVLPGQHGYWPGCAGQEDGQKHKTSKIFCNDDIRTSSATFKNEFPHLKIGEGGVVPSPCDSSNSNRGTSRGRFWGV